MMINSRYVTEMWKPWMFFLVYAQEHRIILNQGRESKSGSQAMSQIYVLVPLQVRSQYRASMEMGFLINDG